MILNMKKSILLNDFSSELIVIFTLEIAKKVHTFRLNSSYFMIFAEYNIFGYKNTPNSREQLKN